MPVAKRDREISLTQVRKKTRDTKENLVEKIRTAVEEYKNVFVFDLENLRSTKFVQIRQQFKDNSQFFLGKKSLMAMALGRTSSEEIADGIHNLSNNLTGQRGLLFTNQTKNSVIKFFKEHSDEDYARAGSKAISSVCLPAGPLLKFIFSMEPQLRALDLPTKINKGTVELVKEFKVCEKDEVLTPEQAKILKLLDIKMSTFRINVVAHWSKKEGFTLFQ